MQQFDKETLLRDLDTMNRMIEDEDVPQEQKEIYRQTVATIEARLKSDQERGANAPCEPDPKKKTDDTPTTCASETCAVSSEGIQTDTEDTERPDGGGTTFPPQSSPERPKEVETVRTEQGHNWLQGFYNCRKALSRFVRDVAEEVGFLRS